MNYLAHLFLSPRDRHSMIGNLMGDFRKYLDGEPLPPRVVAGMDNHRAVDRFTDSHPVVAQLKQLFSHRRRRFSGIILDLGFDHFLSRHWDRYSNESRDGFIRGAYDSLAGGMHLMPERMRRVTAFMIEDDWLGSYARLSGIDRALNGLARRIRFDNCLAGAVEEIAAHYRELEQGFLVFFPDLQANGRERVDSGSHHGRGLDLDQDLRVEQGSHSQQGAGGL